MIKSFANASTRRLFETGSSRQVHPNLARVAVRKMIQLDSAIDLRDLLTPPSNRLELLQPADARRYSIRVNNQWRITFLWSASNDAEEVEFVDYH